MGVKTKKLNFKSNSEFCAAKCIYFKYFQHVYTFSDESAYRIAIVSLLKFLLINSKYSG